MGLISRVSSRTYRKNLKKWLLINLSRSKKCWRRHKNKIVHCLNGLDTKPETRSGITLNVDTGREPSSVCKSFDSVSLIFLLWGRVKLGWGVSCLSPRSLIVKKKISKLQFG